VTFFGFEARFEFVERIEDWMGENHGGEPFFYYLIRCILTQDGRFIASAEGSCNSWESKYRYRTSGRKCPSCGSASIAVSSYGGGGFYCNGKTGGCYAKFPADMPEILNQKTGRVANPDIFDQVNTFLKIGEKRSLVASTLIGANLSEFFTQDVEDFAGREYIEGEFITADDAAGDDDHERSSSRPQGRPPARAKDTKANSQQKAEPGVCSECGAAMTASQMSYSMHKFNAALCLTCQKGQSGGSAQPQQNAPKPDNAGTTPAQQAAPQTPAPRKWRNALQEQVARFDAVGLDEWLSWIGDRYPRTLNKSGSTDLDMLRESECEAIMLIMRGQKRGDDNA
jgi:hypothetical protein